MADQSDVSKAIFDGLPAGDEPAGWRDAPVIDGWTLITSSNEHEVTVVGHFCPDVAPVDAAVPLAALDAERRFVITQEHSVYRLGWPERCSLEPDAAHVWPPGLCLAACSNWGVAILDAIAFTGRDTLPSVLLRNLDAVEPHGNWRSRWAACTAVAEHLRAAGRKDVGEAWALLGADVTNMRSRCAGADLVGAAAGQAAGMYERTLTIDEALADSGWRMLASMDDAQVGKLLREGVPLFDPIAAGRKVALITLGVGGARIPPKQTFDDGEPADGVVVLPKIGGIENSSSGRDAKAAFAAIEGKRLSVTPTPDIEEARRALAAEFPYAATQLGDMVGAASVRIRPTLLVGPPGCGKTRLANRFSRIAGLYVVRFDGAGASDSAFGGTPRRWSTGEPSVPVGALLAAQKADAMCILDEIEKAGTSGHNGRLADSLLPFLEAETARRYPDPYVQAEVDVSRVSYLATANDEMLLPRPLRDRFRLLRISAPTAADLPALARGIVADLARESGSDPRWFPDLDEDELWMAGELWNGGSVRRLRDIVARIVVKRADAPRH
jgi:hypothetical protein